jgi:hypothetical protein
MRNLILNRLILLLPLALLVLIGGCSVYVDGYDFRPRPAVVEVPSTQPTEPPPLSAFATVVGVRRADPDAKMPPSIEIRLRLQNNGPKTITFDPHTLELMNGQLLKFDPPRLDGEGPITLVPMQSAVVDTDFPFPPPNSYYNTDLESLQLHWQVAIDNRPAFMGANFHQFYGGYYEPYWNYPPYVGFGWYSPGVVVVGRR